MAANLISQMGAPSSRLALLPELGISFGFDPKNCAKAYLPKRYKSEIGNCFLIVSYVERGGIARQRKNF